MNSKKGPVDKSARLHFTDEERADPELAPHIRKAEKAADKLDQAKSRLPMKKVIRKERVFDEAKAKPKTRLYFEEINKPIPPSKLTHIVAIAPVLEAHRQINRVQDENTGVEAAHISEQAAETGVRTARSIHRSHQLQPYRTTARLEKKADRADMNALYQKTLRDKSQLSSNPLSRWQQKQAIKRQYAAAKAGKGAETARQTAANTKRTAKKAVETAAKTAVFVVRHWKPILIILGVAVALLLIMNAVSSFLMLFQTGIPSLAISTYPSMDEDMLGAEAAYAAMETKLQEDIDDYETMHSGYDEYRYDLDEISHDPYVLISILTAWHGGEWRTLDEVQGTLAMLFEKQYQLTEAVEAEVRYRTETRKGTHSYTDLDTCETVTEEYEYDALVPYNYTICNVTLHNENLSHLPIYIMSEEKVGMYAIYMSTLGNRPDLFAGYPNASTLEEYPEYEIPDEYLANETFAAIIEEAEKYLGYPYVWGGGNPTTSFDCSGFVTWVLTNSGVLDTGRRSAQGLYNICTPVSAANANPGDLVFFAGTYDFPGISHVGIYVGDGMMIHAGNPIHYASINTPYWQEHFFAYGRPDY